ncbi:hypothetical protein BGZ81_010363 [Podila clonocystis]|nr:hypothetical protein BGZ81_010363 [Podila clonocystis]
MLRLSTFVALALLFLQVAIAQAIEPGKYLIENNQGFLLGVGPTDLPELPVRLFPRHSRLGDVWDVKRGEHGNLLISTRNRFGEFKLVNLRDGVFASIFKEPEFWAITSVGHDLVEIKLPYSDRVFTSELNAPVQVQLQPAEGRDEQKWKFVPIERDNNYRGSTNRFCRQ